MIPESTSTDATATSPKAAAVTDKLSSPDDSSPQATEKIRKEMKQLMFYNPGPLTAELLAFNPEMRFR